MASRVCIIVVNHNRWRDTAECLESALRSGVPAGDLVVVDNASTDDSACQIRAWAVGAQRVEPQHRLSDLVLPACEKPVDVTLLQNAANLGYGGGANLGMRHAIDAGYDHAWLLNNDVLLAPEAWSRLCAFLADEVDPAALVGTMVQRFDRPELIQYAGGGVYRPWRTYPDAVGAGERNAGQYDRMDASEMDYVYGASMCVNLAFVRDVGAIDESYFLYFEELDWAARMRAGGRWRHAFCPAAVVFHKGGASINPDGELESPLSEFYFFRNKLRFTRRHQARWLPVVWAQIARRSLGNVARGRPRRAGRLLRLLVDADHHLGGVR